MRLRSSLLRIVLSAATAFVFAGCYDFDTAIEQCAQVGRCQHSGQEPGAPDGSVDGGDESDGGSTSPDGGTIVTTCTDGGYVLEGRFCKNGWCWDLPKPMGNDLTAVAGANGFVVAGGKGGMLVQIDGCSVSQVPFAGRNGVRDVYVRAPHDFWVVGDQNLATHWLPDGGTETHDFGSANVVAVTGNDDGLLFAATSGTSGSTSSAVLLSGTGADATWTDFLAPLSPPLSAAGALNDWWLVTPADLEHGSSTEKPWSPVTPPSAASGGAWYSPSGRLWLIGNGSDVLRNIETNNATFETRASGLKIDGAPILLHAMSGRSDDSVIVAGESGGLIELRGGEWTQTGLDAQSRPVTSQTYLDLWADPNGPTWAVGTAGALSVGRDDTWNELRTRFGFHTPTNLNAVASDNGLYLAVGDGGRVFQRAAGGQWSPMPAQPAGAGDLLAVTVVGAGHYFAGGVNSLYEYLNGTWSAATFLPANSGNPPTSWQIRAMASISSKVAWAVGNQGSKGLVLLYSNGQWKELGAGMSEPVLYDVFTISETEAWAAGAEGRVTHLTTNGNAQDFTFKNGSGTGYELHAVLPLLSGNVYVGGSGVIGMLDRNNGDKFVTFTDPDLQAQVLRDAVPTSTGPLFVGTAGDAWLVDVSHGNTLTRRATGAQWNLNGAAVDTTGRVLVVGDSGSALTLVP